MTRSELQCSAEPLLCTFEITSHRLGLGNSCSHMRVVRGYCLGQRKCLQRPVSLSRHEQQPAHADPPHDRRGRTIDAGLTLADCLIDAPLPE